MKVKTKVFFFLPALLVMVYSAAFAQKWKELSDFHAVMSKSFHPAEDKNFQPAKENAAQLVVLAKKWQASPIPAGYKKAETTATLKRLVEACEALEKQVKSNPNDDDAINRLITHAHDVFHEIVGKCRDTGDDHKGHKH